MRVCVPSDGVSLSGGASPGISISADALVLTGDGDVIAAPMLGCVVTDITEEPDMFRYRIEVDGTGIRENYEYSEHKDASYVAADWLTDVREVWGDEIAETFRGSVTVTDLWQQTTVDQASEGPKDSQRKSQKDNQAPLGSEDNPVALGPPPQEETQE